MTVEETRVINPLFRPLSSREQQQRSPHHNNIIINNTPPSPSSSSPSSPLPRNFYLSSFQIIFINNYHNNNKY